METHPETEKRLAIKVFLCIWAFAPAYERGGRELFAHCRAVIMRWREAVVPCRVGGLEQSHQTRRVALRQLHAIAPSGGVRRERAARAAAAAGRAAAGLLEAVHAPSFLF